MSSRTDIAALASQLERLAQAEAVPRRTRRDIARLIARMTEPLSLVVCGPDAACVARVAAALGEHLDAHQVTISTARANAASFDQADMVVWVTSDFGPDEAAIWNRAPDALTDHSFLWCMGCTQLPPELAAVAAQYFVAGLPQPTAEPDKTDNLLEIGKHIETGLSAAIDLGSVFVAQYQALLSDTPPVRLSVPRDRPSPSGSAPPWRAMRECIEGSAKALGSLRVSEEIDDIRAILSICCETVQALSETAETVAPDTPGSAALLADIVAAADSMLLMSLEEDVISAIDAVATLHQFQKDFSAAEAA